MDIFSVGSRCKACFLFKYLVKILLAAKAIRECDENAYIMGGSVFTSPVIFLQEAFNTGMANYIDAVTFHEYTYSEENVEQKVRALRGLCKMHGVELDIIQGESGSRSKPYGHGAVYEIPFKEKDSHGTSYFKYLPVKDYPMFLVFGDIDVI